MNERTRIHRLIETTRAGLAAKACGCPVTAATSRECGELRHGQAIGCLCGCHGDAKALAQREYLRQYFEAAARS